MTSSQSRLDPIAEHKYTPKINKNTEKLLQNRNTRLQQQRSPVAAQENPYGAKGAVAKEQGPKIKASDKYLLQKFNKDFDSIQSSIVEPS